MIAMLPRRQILGLPDRIAARSNCCKACDTLPQIVQSAFTVSYRKSRNSQMEQGFSPTEPQWTELRCEACFQGQSCAIFFCPAVGIFFPDTWNHFLGKKYVGQFWQR